MQRLKQMEGGIGNTVDIGLVIKFFKCIVLFVVVAAINDVILGDNAPIVHYMLGILAGAVIVAIVVFD